MKKKKKEIKHDLARRLDYLPKPVYQLVMNYCLERTGLSHVAWGNMRRGSWPNLLFVIELCDLFECGPRELINPQFTLQPEKALTNLERELPQVA